MEKHDSLELLKKISFFRDLEENELAKINQLLIRRSLVERMVVFMQGEPLEYVYFIASGKVKIYRTDEHGREQIVNVLEAGEMFPHVGIFRGVNYPAHSVMIEKGVLLALPTAKLRALLEQNPALSLKLLSVMEGKIIELQGRLEEMVMHDTFGRIVLLLIRLSRLHGVQDGDCIRLTVPFTNQELANMIGTSRETVSRTLSQLKKAGALETTADHYLLVNLDRLEKQLRI
ncbi:Crp/Fnr family transcriptional regulator [Effusibacillus lacus]|uniref:Crp/Fnr family transcriptional regulator n=1 Tax=Effusibacillus lacus TaxID=1348429 RepID=A0A292YRI9_9BACL|nr:Crp/Fnr family transcriptional regulator [Effusibacillus lacus]GAX91383.1 Crp/Fnr family transcriptional regulator [Effusibacillus lacus]